MFFDNIDEKATIAKAKNVLTSYRRLERIAGIPYSLGSSSNHQQTRHGKPHKANAKHEKHIMKTMTAEQERDQIRQAVEQLDEIYRTILLLKYCQRHSLKGFEIMQSVGYGQTRYYELQREALLQFAECYKHGELLTYAETREGAE